MSDEQPIADGKILTVIELIGIMHARHKRGEALTVLPLTREQLIHLRLDRAATQFFGPIGFGEEIFDGVPIKEVRAKPGRDFTATEVLAARAEYGRKYKNPPTGLTLLAPFVERTFAILRKHGLLK